jgi:hypothetical protein
MSLIRDPVLIEDPNGNRRPVPRGSLRRWTAVGWKEVGDELKVNEPAPPRADTPKPEDPPEGDDIKSTRATTRKSTKEQ